MLHRGFHLTLVAAAALALFVASVPAFTPIIAPIPDVIIGDHTPLNGFTPGDPFTSGNFVEAGGGGDGEDVFQYIDAFNIFDLVGDSPAVAGSTADADLTYEFVATASTGIADSYTINGTTITTAGVTVAIVTAEATLDFVDAQSNSVKGSVIGTLDYDVNVPSNPSVNNGLAVSGASVINENTMTLTVTNNQGNPAVDTFQVYTVDDNPDSISGSAVVGLVPVDLSAWTYVAAIVTDGALGTTFDGDEEATGNIQADDDSDGSGSDLSLDTGTTAGDSYHFFQSPLRQIPFVDGASYRTQWTVSSAVTDPALGAQLRTRFGYGAFGNLGNGNQVVSAVVSLPGSGTTYSHLFDQLDVSTANTVIDLGAPGTMPENDMLLFFELIDIGGATSGDLELDDLLIERLNRATLRGAETMESTISDFTTSDTIGGIQFGVTAITVGTTTGNATITAPVTNAANLTVFGSLPLNLVEDGVALNAFTPSATNGLSYRTQVTMDASANNTTTPLPLATLRVQSFNGVATLYTTETQVNSTRSTGDLNPNYDSAGDIFSGYLALPAGAALDGSDPDGAGIGIGFGDQMLATIQLQDQDDAQGGALIITDVTMYSFPEGLLP